MTTRIKLSRSSIVRKNIQAYMDVMRLNQTELSARAQISQSAISKFLRFKMRDITIDTMEAIADGLGVPSFLLLQETTEQEDILRLLKAIDGLLPEDRELIIKEVELRRLLIDNPDLFRRK